MGSPLVTAGVQYGPAKYGTLYIDTFFTGLWTNSSPLRDAAVPYIYRKLYSGGRFDRIIDGLNTEISPRLTLIRRPGFSSFCNQPFNPINDFYSHRIFDPDIFAEIVEVLIDVNTGVNYIAPPNVNSQIYGKAAGAGQASFQSVGNVLYMADGKETRKWNGTVVEFGRPGPPTLSDIAGGSLGAVTYTVSITYTNAWGETIGSQTSSRAVGANRLLVVQSPPGTGVFPSNATGYNVYAGTGGFTWRQNVNPIAIGTDWTEPPAGIVFGADGFNADFPPITNTTDAAYNVGIQRPPAPTVSGNFWQANKIFINLSGVDDTIMILDNNLNTQTAINPSGGTTKMGRTLPQWAATFGDTTAEHVISGTGFTWTNTGPITGWEANKVQALTTNNIINGSVALGHVILDSNGKLQQVSTAGTTGAAPPVWNVTLGGTTADNTVTWTCMGFGPTTFISRRFAYAYKSWMGGYSSLSPIVTIETPILGDPDVQGDGSVEAEVMSADLFASLDGGSSLLFAKSAPNDSSGGPQHWDYDLTDDQLNEFITGDDTGINSLPPAGITQLAYYLNRLWGAVGNLAYWSAFPNQSIGINTDNWPPLNFFRFPATVTKFFPTTTGMIFFTNSGCFISSGLDSSGNPAQPVPFLSDISLLSANCFTVNGNNPILFTADHQLLYLDPGSGASRIGFPIEDQLQNFDPTASYVTWHTEGPDQACYISNGDDTWFRVNITPAPETGSYTWSPKGVLGAGFRAMKSIEVSPGVRSLLLGTTNSSGVIKRDPSVNSDNGTTYTAFTTLGSILLGEPGTIGETACIITECIAVGTNVSLSILADEISGSFEGFGLSTPDPPAFPTSSTVYASRWYFDQLSQPSWFRNCQLKLSWPAENQPNEVLTVSLVSKLHPNDGANE